MVAEPQTIRVPHCVEKRIPVTYSYNVGRLVCYRVPLDSCGEPLVGPALGTVAPAAPGAILVPGTAPAGPQPTPARRSDGANVKPEIPADAPRPIDSQDDSSVRELGPLKKLPPKESSAPDDRYPPYPSKGT